jgi:hypothetical protein
MRCSKPSLLNYALVWQVAYWPSNRVLGPATLTSLLSTEWMTRPGSSSTSGVVVAAQSAGFSDELWRIWAMPFWMFLGLNGLDQKVDNNVACQDFIDRASLCGSSAWLSDSDVLGTVVGGQALTLPDLVGGKAPIAARSMAGYRKPERSDVVRNLSVDFIGISPAVCNPLKIDEPAAELSFDMISSACLEQIGKCRCEDLALEMIAHWLYGREQLISDCWERHGKKVGQTSHEQAALIVQRLATFPSLPAAAKPPRRAAEKLGPQFPILSAFPVVS